MAISAMVQTVLLSNQEAFNEFRYWASGSVEGRGWDVFATVAPFIVIGLILALITAPALNALALGDDTGKALGVQVTRTRTLVIIGVTLLAGAATAAVGPIMFVGLAVPYLARVIVMPAEVQTGIMSALVGGPIFIAIVRRKNLETFS